MWFLWETITLKTKKLASRVKVRRKKDKKTSFLSEAKFKLGQKSVYLEAFYGKSDTQKVLALIKHFNVAFGGEMVF